MEYNKPLSKCICGKLPQLMDGNYNNVKYCCNKDNLSTFYSSNELTARELWNSMLKNIKTLKVRI